jgi:four helix bundle protein
MKENVVKPKSFAFALRVMKVVKYLQGEKKEFVLSKQVLRSGTAIGALVREAEHAESKADFPHKMNIALKEASETLTGWNCCIRPNTSLTRALHPSALTTKNLSSFWSQS